MNLLIEGMDMPKHAVRNGTDDTMYRSCVLVHPNGTAELVVDLEFAYQFNFEHNLKRFPLSEIPTPHGRLIDADALSKALEKRWNVDDDQDFANKSVWRELENAPTIVEAEGNT